MHLDVTNAAEWSRVVKATVEKFGKLDILVNNAVINIRKPPQDFSVEEWDSVFSVNLKSAFLMSQ